jgi:hypothetical protein
MSLCVDACARDPIGPSHRRIRKARANRWFLNNPLIGLRFFRMPEFGGECGKFA